MTSENLTEAGAQPLGAQTESIVTKALDATKKADELRAAAIEQLLERIKQDQDALKKLGYVGLVQSNGTGRERAKLATPETLPRTKRFVGQKLSDIGKALLLEYGPLHGKKIEEIAKKGGYRSKNRHFQTYLRLALERAGGFENTGGNSWRLNDQIKPKPVSKGST